MEREWLEYPDLAPSGPTYTRAVKAGNTLYISGCTARDTAAESGSPIDQFKVTMDRVVSIVELEGGSAIDIVKMTTFVTSMADWWPVTQEQQDVYDEHFGEEKPANSLIEISALALPGLVIEIEAIAVLD